MARVVLRYEDGRAIWSDNDPGRARVSGYGGTLVTHVVTAGAPIRHRLPRDPLSLTRPRAKCGYIMPMLKEPCARMPGHRDDHRPALYMIENAARRAKWRAL